MEIISYKNTSDIPEKYLPSLVDAQIECWWAKPFDEYMICSDENCKAVYSIEDVFWSYEDFKKYNTNTSIDFNCKCWCDTELMYPKEDFYEVLIEYFKWEVITTLLLDNDTVKWFWVLRKTSLNDILYNKLDYRPDSYNKDVLCNLLLEKSKEINCILDKEFIYSDQIYVSPSSRKWNISYEVIKTPFQIIKKLYWELPIVGETRYASKFYPISRAMWYEDLLSDKYWNVFQFSDSIDKVLNFFEMYKSFWDKSLIKKIIKYKKYSNYVINNNPNYNSRKFYI